MQKAATMVVKYILFDCDNTLVLSEDVAFEACCDLVNEMLETHGVDLRYEQEALISEFVGLTFRGMIAVLQQRLCFSLTPEEVDAYVKMEDERVVAKLEAYAQPCPGSVEVLSKLRQQGAYKLAVVSSSSLPRIRACLAKTGQDKFFDENCIFSAASSLPKPAGKPDPAIYLHAMKQLGAKPSECIAIEDSMSGAMAATSANVRFVGYVGSYHTNGQKFEMVNKFSSLTSDTSMWHWDEFEKILAAFEFRVIN